MTQELPCVNPVGKHMPKTSRKRRIRRRKLNLTITLDSRRDAEALAARQHRSISNLFEHLVEIELRREARLERAEQEHEKRELASRKFISAVDA